MAARLAESGSACRSERSNLSLVLYEPRQYPLRNNVTVPLNQGIRVYGKLRIRGAGLRIHTRWRLLEG